QLLGRDRNRAQARKRGGASATGGRASSPRRRPRGCGQERGNLTAGGSKQGTSTLNRPHPAAADAAATLSRDAGEGNSLRRGEIDQLAHRGGGFEGGEAVVDLGELDAAGDQV